MRVLLKTLKKFFIRFWPFILILFLIVVFFWKFFLLGQIPLPGDFVVGTYYPWLDYKWGYAVGVPVKNPITTDVVSFTYPMRILAVTLLKNGIVPLWNRYILTGIPLMANFQSAPFTFTNIFYFIFNNYTAWGFQIVFQHIAAFIFTFLLLRYLKLSKLASIFGGLVYAFSGFNMIWSQWNAHTLAASFIPLTIYLLARWLDESKRIFLYFFAFVVFIQIISGYPQIVFYNLPVTVFFVLFRLKNKFDLKIWISYIISVCLSLGMGAFLILQSRELLALSQRAIEPLEFSWAFLPWQKIITFVAPDYFGNHATINYWGPTDYTTTTGYVGVAAFSLTCMAFFMWKKIKEVRFFIFVLFLSLLLSFPTFLSIFIWKEGFFGMQAASAHRALVLFIFSVSVLASYSFDNLKIMKPKNIILSLIVPGMILCAYGLFSAVGYFTNGNYFGLLNLEMWKIIVSIRNMALPITFFIVTSFIFITIAFKNVIKWDLKILLFIICIFELFRFGWKFTPFVKKEIIFPETPVLEYIQNKPQPFRVVSEGVIPINMKMPYGIESLEGYDAIYPVCIAQMIASINSGLANASPQGRYANVTNLGSNIIDLLNVKYVIDVKRDTKGNPDENGSSYTEMKYSKYFQVFADKTTVVLENKNVIPRAYIYSDWKVTNANDSLIGMLSSDFNPRDTIYLSKDPNIEKEDSGSGKYEYIKYSDSEQIIKADSSGNAILFVSDLNYPGWKAYVNGNEEKIITADYCFKAIPIRKGTSYIKLLYKPESFASGKIITLLSFSLWIILLIYELGSSKRGGRSS